MLKYLTAVVFLFLLTLPIAAAELGPKDRRDLKPTEIDRVKVGQSAPDFSLEDTDGKAISLSDFRGKKSVILVFYRGYW